MTIGNDILPGIITDIESLSAVSTSGLSDANVAVVGGGDVANATAEPNKPYTITRPTNVETLFGSGSELSKNVLNALGEGAMPVYAVMTDEVESVFDIGDLGSTEGTLPDAPVRENDDAVEFEADSTVLDVTWYFGDLSSASPDENEVILNPATGDFVLASTPTSGTVTYDALDYDGALDSLESEEADVLDAIGVLAENYDVNASLEATVDSMESYHQFALAVTGADSWIDTSTYENPFSNSRVQIAYPARDADGTSTIGALVGLRGKLGIRGSVMNKRLKSHSRLSHRLDRAEQGDLVRENVVPLASETSGALVVDDPTSIPDDDPDEGEMSLGFTRMVIDRVTEIVKESEEPFIGRLNSQSSRGSLQAVITARLRFLEEQDAILDYEIRVVPKDADSAFVDVQVETVKPLRNIYNTVAAGRIE